MISETIGYEGEILWDQSKPDGTPRKVLDVSILSQLGWEAKTNLKDGIKLTLENYIKEHIKKNQIFLNFQNLFNLKHKFLFKYFP